MILSLINAGSLTAENAGMLKQRIAIPKAKVLDSFLIFQVVNSIFNFHPCFVLKNVRMK